MDLFLHSVSFWTNWPSLVLDFVTGAKCPIGMPCLSRISMQRSCFSFAMLQMTSAKPIQDRKSTRLNSSHRCISYAVFCLKKKKKNPKTFRSPSTTQHLSSSYMRYRSQDG